MGIERIYWEGVLTVYTERVKGVWGEVVCGGSWGVGGECLTPPSSLRSSCCTYTIFKCGGMPSMFPLPMFVNNVVLPAPFFPMMPYLRPRPSRSFVLCKRIFPPKASENSMSQTLAPSSSSSSLASGTSPKAAVRNTVAKWSP